MTFLRKIALWALAAAALCSCSKKVTVITVDEVFFTASVKAYNTKASGSALADGEQVRIMAGSPIDATAVGTVLGRDLTFDVPLNWTRGQKASTTFAAVYQAGKVADAAASLSYDLLSGGRHDYYSHDSFLAAVRTAAPHETVNLEFGHPFSKIVLNIQNNLSGETVTKVTVRDVVMKGTVDLNAGKLRLTGPRESFEAVNVSIGSYAAVVMPQTAAPLISITTNKGSVYNFALDAPFVFEPGCAYSADITLSAGQFTPATFTFTASSWEDGGTLNYEPVE
ncbi:MAG: fimbrillin family protein [Bacteroidales bacterium]|nr:fimbrillin family protein [Bacteroidales bacterium]